jgi:hypothetical protein
MNRTAANRIKANMLFKKKDTGIIIRIISKAKDDAFLTERVNRNKTNGIHSIKKHDLLKHYICI